MSYQENPWSWSWRWRRSGALLSWVLLVVLSASVGGCGGSNADMTAATARPLAPCVRGKPVVPHVPEAPPSWTKGPRPAIALGCDWDNKVDPGTAIAGYPMPGGGSCVSVYFGRRREVFGELCEPTGTEWTSLCEGPGCVHYFNHEADSTILVGPVPASVTGVWADVHGKYLVEGVVFVNVHGKSMHAIGAKEPFGFFSVYIPRCAEPSEVQVHMVSGSKQAGLADEWDVEEPKCPPGHSAHPS
jgi:hypothetical protein